MQNALQVNKARQKLSAPKAEYYYANGEVLGRKMFGLKGSILPDREPGMANGGTSETTGKYRFLSNQAVKATGSIPLEIHVCVLIPKGMRMHRLEPLGLDRMCTRNAFREFLQAKARPKDPHLKPMMTVECAYPPIQTMRTSRQLRSRGE